MTLRELVEWLKDLPASQVVHLGNMEASREDYSRPALTLVLMAEAQDALKAIEDGLSVPHEGWKGGVYRYTLDDEVFFNVKWGTPGFRLTPETLEAFGWGMTCGGQLS
jgi:hypothetical protein